MTKRKVSAAAKVWWVTRFEVRVTMEGYIIFVFISCKHFDYAESPIREKW